MSVYLPLCAFRQGLLPDTCRTCAWWQTTGREKLSPETAADKRGEWMVSLEATWGATGLLLQDGGPRAGAVGPDSTDETSSQVIGSISFAPANSVPRLRALPFISLPAGSAFLFCLRSEPEQCRYQAKRLLHKALAQLKARGMNEAYALAGSFADPDEVELVKSQACGLLSAELLSTNGFEQVMENGGAALMRVDLRGLLSLIGQVQTAVRRVLHNEPAPSPAAWTHRGTP